MNGLCLQLLHRRDRKNDPDRHVVYIKCIYPGCCALKHQSTALLRPLFHELSTVGVSNEKTRYTSRRKIPDTRLQTPTRGQSMILLGKMLLPTRMIARNVSPSAPDARYVDKQTH